jgi:hypothetical protein
LRALGAIFAGHARRRDRVGGWRLGGSRFDFAWLEVSTKGSMRRQCRDGYGPAAEPTGERAEDSAIGACDGQIDTDAGSLCRVSTKADVDLGGAGFGRVRMHDLDCRVCPKDDLKKSCAISLKAWVRWSPLNKEHATQDYGRYEERHGPVAQI